MSLRSRKHALRIFCGATEVRYKLLDNQSVCVRLGERADLTRMTPRFYDLANELDLSAFDAAESNFTTPGSGYGQLVVAEIGQRIVGRVFADIHTRPASAGLIRGSVGIIQMLSVVPENEKQGIGEALITVAERYIKTRAMRFVEVGANSPQLVQRYEHYGYRIVEARYSEEFNPQFRGITAIRYTESAILIKPTGELDTIRFWLGDSWLRRDYR